MTEIINSKRRQIALGLPAGLLLPTGLLLPGVAAATGLSGASKAAGREKVQIFLSKRLDASRAAATTLDYAWFQQQIFFHYLDGEKYWSSLQYKLLVRAVEIWNAFFTLKYDVNDFRSRLKFVRDAIPLLDNDYPDIKQSCQTQFSALFWETYYDDVEMPYGSFERNRGLFFERLFNIFEGLIYSADISTVIKLRESEADFFNFLYHLAGLFDHNSGYQIQLKKIIDDSESAGDYRRLIQTINSPDNITVKTVTYASISNTTYTPNVTANYGVVVEKVDLKDAHAAKMVHSIAGTLIGPKYSQEVLERHGLRNSTVKTPDVYVGRTYLRLLYYVSPLMPEQPNQTGTLEHYVNQTIDENGPYVGISPQASKTFLREVSRNIMEITAETPYNSVVVGGSIVCRVVIQALNCVIRSFLYFGYVNLAEVEKLLDTEIERTAARADALTNMQPRLDTLIDASKIVFAAALTNCVLQWVMWHAANKHYRDNPNATDDEIAAASKQAWKALAATISTSTTGVGVFLLRNSMILKVSPLYRSLIPGFFGASDLNNGLQTLITLIRYYGAAPDPSPVSGKLGIYGTYGTYFFATTSIFFQVGLGGFTMIQSMMRYYYGEVDAVNLAGTNRVVRYILNKKTPVGATALGACLTTFYILWANVIV
jgi:hypothetical protein